MKRIVFASIREGAGKTSLMVGLMSRTGKKFGYIKPFGDRLIYKRKKNWDYDSNLIIDIFGLNEEPENISLGFDHSKLRYVYDEKNIQGTLREMAENASAGKDILFIEGGRDLSYGASLNLDSLSVAGYIDAELVVVVSGGSDTVVDDLMFINRYVNTGNVKFSGVIINKVRDVDEFDDVYARQIREIGVRILGVVPFKEQLTHFTISYLADKLYAKVIAGDKGMTNIVKNIFVGAMSTDESLRNPLFNKENKFLITSGDRNDMILAALESDTAGVLLTNNILPPSNIIAKAAEKNIPLILVTMDTYQVTKQIDRMESLLTKENEDRIKLLSQMTEKYVTIEGAV
ncbi:MAG: AAA family ATPase [Spirochaetes bacterium]|jgi:hypothetical protein|nr:AAA family ATPase [Spirochaetota bacterium]